MKKSLILVSLLFLAACNPSKTTKANVIRSGASNLNGFSSQCTNTASNMGRIYDTGQMGLAGTFEDRVKALLSATIYSSEIGQISGNPNDQSTGVTFNGLIKLDQNGAVVPALSSMSIKVYDSFSGSSGAIPIEFASTKGAQIQGQFNPATGEGFVNFSDSYGIVRFEGRFDAQTFSGVVKFQNSTNVNGGAGMAGTLGQFSVARCGIIQ